MSRNTNHIRRGNEWPLSLASLALSAIGVVMFALSFSTGYYVFGEKNSVIVASALTAAIVAGAAGLAARLRWPESFWPQLLAMPAIMLLVFGAVRQMGDRVEGIGNCIVTDYDAGHGGELACWLSIVSFVLLLSAAVCMVVGCFGDMKPNRPVTVMEVADGADA